MNHATVLSPHLLLAGALLLSAAAKAQGSSPGAVSAAAANRAADAPAVRQPSLIERAELAAGLREMMRLDQLHRTPVSWGTTDPKELARLEALDDAAHLAEAKRRWREGIELPKAQRGALMAKQGVLDRENFDHLMRWVRAFGYPDPDRLELDAPSPLPVLIHARLEQFDAVRSVLEVEAKAGRMPAKEFAALSDRKAQHAGRRQLYGTCHRFDPKSGKVLPPEIEDLAKTNAARTALGLPPLEKYLIVPGRD
ncbi:MAG: hypothetical protein NXI31_20200 [bacterium]|nr:hypothetical protein [bacterium]